LTAGRRSGAPRLIEWTGERCVPWAPDVQVVYEHLHRYAWAAELVAGRRVLDLASGEGFGAAILARCARSVTGIEIDQQTVDHSSLNYAGDKVEFMTGDARDLSAFPDDSFGAVVAFELIEHIEDQARVMSEIDRVLEPDGLLLISTPDRRAYAGRDVGKNPFHVRELDLSEFRSMLGEHFEHYALFGQRTIAGSALSALQEGSEVPESVAPRSFFVEPDGDEWSLTSGLSPLYLVAVASRMPLPALPADSTLADGDLALVKAAERSGTEALEEYELELENGERERSELQRRLVAREAELVGRRRRIDELRDERDQLSAELAVAQRLNAEIRTSITWKAYRRGRTKAFALLGGEGSIPVRLIQATLRGVARAVRGVSTSYSAPSVVFPEFSEPRVSLVIPLHSGARLTAACLESVIDHTGETAYEVILIDDGADRETKALLANVHGARILVNETNIGYLRSVKRGADEARGEWLVLCNNDIEVREGWLDAMLDCGDRSPDVAVVTPKYLYPNGSLNEAGGIIWPDGTGMNYGRGYDPSLFHYEFTREVDYGSAAALLVRTSFWHDAGGFDERFAPMYYEDTDLCFQARERGLRVMYEPRAIVVHLEGGTAGTDASAGHKRFQEINRAKFVEKWGPRLAEQTVPGLLDPREASNRARGPRVLIVDHRVPRWDMDSGSLRMKGMIDELLALGCRITLLPEDVRRSVPYGPELQRLGVEVWHDDINPIGELEAIGPELSLVIVCRPHTSSRWLDIIREVAPSASVVYDTVDLHWLRESRKGSATDPMASPGSKAAALREIELALIRASDATLVVTKEERALVEADVPGAVVWVAPNVNPVRDHVPPVSGRAGVVFVGGFEHPPNTDAVVRIVRRVMPIVWRRLGPVPVTVVGSSAPPEVRDLASTDVEIAGWIPAVDPVLDRARVMLAPLSWGAGLKGKVTQALAAGLPVVTTSIGAEGLDAADGEQLLIADDDAGLAERVITILTDDTVWMSVSAAGQALAEAVCSPEVMHRVLAEILEAGSTLRSGTYRQAQTELTGA
jgi:GT2 family glycosyltransferase/SAM-dependent methyltransferase/glycosyltransferase involved in cell wall biosynthesis